MVCLLCTIPIQLLYTSLTLRLLLLLQSRSCLDTEIMLENLLDILKWETLRLWVQENDKDPAHSVSFEDQIAGNGYPVERNGGDDHAQ